MSKKPEVPEAHTPADYDVADAAALQALGRGEASPEQQRRALRWIIEGAANTYDLSYRPQDTGAMAFSEGRRFVGLQMVKLLKFNLGALREAKAARDGKPAPAPGEQPGPPKH